MKPMYINGDWIAASDDETIDIYNPATAEIIDIRCDLPVP